MRRRLALAAVGATAAIGLAGLAAAQPAAAAITTYTKSKNCTSGSRYYSATVTWQKNTISAQVDPTKVVVKFYTGTSAADWSTSLTVADKLGTSNIESWSGNPASSITVSFPRDYWTSPSNRSVYVNASGGGTYCGPISILP